MLTRFIKSIFLGALFISLVPISANAGGVLPYIKITINNGTGPDIGGRRVGFIRPTAPGSFSNNVFNFNGLQVKQLTNNGGTILDLQASQETLAWVRVFFGQTLEWDVFSFDKGAAKNVSKTPEVIEDGLNVGGRNIVWTAFDTPDDTYHVYRNQGANTVAITEGFQPGIFRLRGRPRASETDNIVWAESLNEGTLGYFDAEDDEIRILDDGGDLTALGHTISGHRVAWISSDGASGGEPERLKLYNGKTEQTTVLAEEGGPFGTPGFFGGEQYDHPHLIFGGSALWIMNVLTGEAVDYFDAIAPLTFGGQNPEISDGFAASTALDLANNRMVVVLYDIDRDKVRIIASYPFEGNASPQDVRISGPNLVWQVNEFLDEEPFVKNSVVVAYRLDEYVKILLGL